MTDASLKLVAATEFFLQQTQEYRATTGPDLTGRPSFGALQSELSGQYPTWSSSSSTDLIVVTPDLPVNIPPEMPDCLARLLCCVNQDEPRALRPIAILLVAIERHGCLPYFSGEASRCYDLARALLLYVLLTKIPSSLPSGLNEAENVFVCQLLNTWCRPAEPWLTPPSAIELAEHLFGAAWVLFADRESDLIGDVVARELPPFAPGICSAQEDAVGITLPESMGLGS
jgi:hypothetical protein